MKTVWFIDDKNQISSGELLQINKSEYLIGCQFGQKLRRVSEVYDSCEELQAKISKTKTI